MSYPVIGCVTCVECGAEYQKTKMMDVGSDDSYGSLIWCDSEQCKGKWVRWT